MGKLIALQLCANCGRPAKAPMPLVCDGRPDRGEPSHVRLPEVCENCADRELGRLGGVPIGGTLEWVK
jgi:hypothetical protein